MKHFLHLREELLASQAELDQFLADHRNPEGIGILVLAEGHSQFRHQTTEERAANLKRHEDDVANLTRARDFWANAVSAEERRLLGPSDAD